VIPDSCLFDHFCHATLSTGTAALTWTNPADADWAETVVRRTHNVRISRPAAATHAAGASRVVRLHVR
jgi:hypothetical protein